MDFEQARNNMIEGQVRPWLVNDPHVLELLRQVHRENFVPPAYRQLALSDYPIPLGQGQTAMTPGMEARLLQSVAVQPDDKILEVGTGCAYLTALLARSGGHVHSMDIIAEFVDQAWGKLKLHQIRNVSLCDGDALHGWAQQAPYDVIVVGGSLPQPDPACQQQLNIGGRLFVVLGTPPAMQATLITRIGERAWSTDRLFETTLPALIGAHERRDFQF